jgi:putative membrane protein
MKNKNYLLLGIIIGLFILALLVFWYFSPNWINQNEYPYYGHMVGGWFMPFGMILMGCFWIGIIYFVFNGFSNRNNHQEDRAIETLNIRLAKGEITIEEYETLMNKMRDK